ncbi:MAG: hypothetical protein GTO53_00310 [Planctomycetales bacterium]|nr:hypothetical protein [Planctomycetales bacterium]NIM07623.1 hypothetical protein [Planctomycetales bacterium]NIN07129.1 hypothetical protein [Planctomycetales bacterium]NIN76223.1 hypothetical protein [Planctomycetales bacterium]NIO33445.1 hypothetical protein [Planctomycetales bacterium]
MLPGPLLRYLEQLRYPYLFMIMLVLLAVNLVLPDPFLLIDELLLAIGTILLASIRKRKTDRQLTRKAKEGSDP